MSETEDVRFTRAAYDDVAQLYTDLVREQLRDNPFDRGMLDAFAHSVRESGTGPVAEIGCGPGRIAAHLAANGLEMSGIDLSPEMIRLARAAHPDIPFEVGSMDRLPFGDAALAGIVAWYSIIHTPPQRLPAVLTEFARVLLPGGHALFGFQATDEPTGTRDYAHRVAPAYRWAPDTFAEVLADNGFRATTKFWREARPDERTPQGTVFAIRL
ncbi:class I SAM-dependent DNA methyltransferase [Nocardia seriolae]|uniref:Methyltransferase n=1 Tax=Nocardia seriolae TaxID=37332 RepID=A0A0B8NM45_9NOCA|nr:class I SAM-dependent methyltransferase [Nocardia seriolae]MTJ66913.1 methyltransferase domain-containing protein [Nocardia seriolae]MTJ74254.1 methyltransferase domain-containing protein [Nocardia seriolae]MTJ84895.1 methyltransferase domain-containing protein [Nocardia seriolae]MTK28891.1 methyltransferase domain-containing protein [Nocardia seriolae]MTK44921.1 methyltransferase domain-containing protein [Nocardia seriolae]